MVSTATAAQTLDSDAFNQLVLEKELKTWTQKGYIYAGFRGARGWELYRTLSGHKWLYQARRIATQGNAGGGPMIVDITMGAGQVGKIVSMVAVNGAVNNDLFIRKLDEDNALAAPLAYVATGASNLLAIPSIGTPANASGNFMNSAGMLILPGEKLSVIQTTASAQNATLSIALELELFNLATEPTWDKSRSTNAADVTLAASTISAVNTLQEVMC